MNYRFSLYSFSVLFILFLQSTTKAQSIEQYIALYAQTSDLEDLSIDFNQSSLLEADLIFFGFIHGGATPQLMDFELLKHAVQNGDVRYYAPEVNASQAYFLNQYLVSGDESFLDFALYFYTMKVPQDASMQLREKWLKIYGLNQQLPADQRLEVIGTDTPFSSDKRLAITHLAYLLEGRKTGKAMLDSLQYFRSMDIDIRHIWSGKPAWPMVQKHGGQVYDYVFPLNSRFGFANRFMAYYESNLEELTNKLSTFGIDASDILDYKGDDREAHIFINFEKHVIPLIKSGKKVYSNFGYSHIHQHEIYGKRYLAAKIKEKYVEVKQHSVLGLLAKSSVLKGRKWKRSGESITERGLTFEGMISKGYSTSKSWDGDGLFERLEGMDQLLKASKSSDVLFMDLNETGSSYLEKPYLVAYKRGGKGTQIDPNSNTIDYFQSVILMKHSKPNVPLSF